MEIKILGVPVFEGCNIRGVEKAPEVLRQSDVFTKMVKHFTVTDLGDISLIPSNEETMFSANENIKYMNVMIDMSNKIYESVRSTVASGALSIVVGGDHSVATGSVAGSSVANKGQIGVIWFDAHSDINTPNTSPSKNYHGMPLASSLYVGQKELRSIGEDKRKVKPSNTFLVGVRSMDQGELELKEATGINHFTMSFIQQRGMKAIVNDIVNKLKDDGIEKIHLSFDLDALSTDVTTAYNCPIEKGITHDEVILFFSLLFATGKVCSMDITEYNPSLDTDKSGITILKEIVDTITDALLILNS